MREVQAASAISPPNSDSRRKRSQTDLWILCSSEKQLEVPEIYRYIPSVLFSSLQHQTVSAQDVQGCLLQFANPWCFKGTGLNPKLSLPEAAVCLLAQRMP